MRSRLRALSVPRTGSGMHLDAMRRVRYRMRERGVQHAMAMASCILVGSGVIGGRRQGALRPSVSSHNPRLLGSRARGKRL